VELSAHKLPADAKLEARAEKAEILSPTFPTLPKAKWTTLFCRVGLVSKPANILEERWEWGHRRSLFEKKPWEKE